MKVYFDLVFILNFIFDFLLLLSVVYILKRNVKLKRILFGALVGSSSIFLLFLNFNNLGMFLFKGLVSILMILATFSFENLKYFLSNLFYLYVSSVILGGGLYLLNNEFSYQNNGLMFFNNKFGLNIVVLVIAAPIILYFYIKQTKKLRTNYNNYYKVKLYYEDIELNFTAFLDTGNKLKDQYKNRPIILINTDKIDFSYEKSILVPYSTVNGRGVLKCLIVDKIVIDDNLTLDKPLVGLSNEKFNIEGIDMILNNESLEGGKTND